MPKAAPKLKPAISDPESSGPEVIYLPSCASRTMAPSRGEKDQTPLAEKTLQLLRKAGFNVIIPDGLDDLCCGMPFQSKGMFDAADTKARETETLLLQYSDNGRIPIYSDTSPCSLRLQEKIDPRLKLYDTIDFIDRFMMDRLIFTPCNEEVALHITCSATRMGQTEKIKKIIHACSNNVVVPDQITCCGFAGDKGFSTPELNASSLRTLKTQVQHCDSGYSTSRTCEIGLTHHSGIDYKSIVYLIDRCTQAKVQTDTSNEENKKITAAQL